MENMEPIISIAHFKMQFGKTEVIKNLSFEVKRGETFGFLGSNGSGKTTTIRALLGIYQPTAGELLVGGKPYSVSAQPLPEPHYFNHVKLMSKYIQLQITPRINVLSS